MWCTSTAAGDGMAEEELEGGMLRPSGLVCHASGEGGSSGVDFGCGRDLMRCVPASESWKGVNFVEAAGVSTAAWKKVGNSSRVHCFCKSVAGDRRTKSLSTSLLFLPPPDPLLSLPACGSGACTYCRQQTDGNTQ